MLTTSWVSMQKDDFVWTAAHLNLSCCISSSKLIYQIILNHRAVRSTSIGLVLCLDLRSCITSCKLIDHVFFCVRNGILLCCRCCRCDLHFGGGGLVKVAAKGDLTTRHICWHLLKSARDWNVCTSGLGLCNHSVLWTMRVAQIANTMRACWLI